MTGCATKRVQPKPNKFSADLLGRLDHHHAPSREDTSLILAESAISVSQSLSHLAEIQRAVHPHDKLPPLPDPVSIGMAGNASVDWAGPVEPLVQKIARATHYKVRVIGRRPAIPIIVSITAKNVPLSTILRDLSFQSNHQATVMLYPHRRLMELRYLNR